MQFFVNLFLLSGVLVGIALNFAPELFSGVAIKGGPAPTINQSSSPAQTEVNTAHSLTKVVSIFINDHHFSVELESIDRVTVMNTARKLCVANAGVLNIREEEIETGCVPAVADHIFKDVFNGELSQYPVSVTVPINDVGAFDLQFDLMKTTPHEVAVSFCRGKQSELNIASEEVLMAQCVPSVEQFIIADLKARGVLDAETPAAAAEPVAEVAAAPVQPVPTEHNSPAGPHIPFTPEEEAALKVAENEIAHQHHHDAVPPVDVSRLPEV